MKIWSSRRAGQVAHVCSMSVNYLSVSYCFIAQILSQSMELCQCRIPLLKWFTNREIFRWEECLKMYYFVILRKRLEYFCKVVCYPATTGKLYDWVHPSSASPFTYGTQTWSTLCCRYPNTYRCYAISKRSADYKVIKVLLTTIASGFITRYMHYYAQRPGKSPLITRHFECWYTIN